METCCEKCNTSKTKAKDGPSRPKTRIVVTFLNIMNQNNTTVYYYATL